MSLRKQILENLVAAVRTVTVANGYLTDIGVSTKLSLDGALERVGMVESGVIVTPNQVTRTEQASGITTSTFDVNLYGWTRFPIRDGEPNRWVWDTLDDIALDLERVVTLDHTRGGLAHDTLPQSVAYVSDVDNDAVAWVLVNLRILHQHTFTDPGVY